MKLLDTDTFGVGRDNHIGLWCSIDGELPNGDVKVWVINGAWHFVMSRYGTNLRWEDGCGRDNGTFDGMRVLFNKPLPHKMGYNEAIAYMNANIEPQRFGYRAYIFVSCVKNFFGRFVYAYCTTKNALVNSWKSGRSGKPPVELKKTALLFSDMDDDIPF